MVAYTKSGLDSTLSPAARYFLHAVCLLALSFATNSSANETPKALISNCLNAATPLKLQISELLVTGDEDGLNDLAGPVDSRSSDKCQIAVNGHNIEISPTGEVLAGTQVRLESEFDAEEGFVIWNCIGEGLPQALLPPRCESSGEVSEQVLELLEPKD